MRERSRRIGRPPRADLDVPWQQDQRAVAFLEAHPDGASFEEIATALGCSREQVRIILRDAETRLAAELRARGIDAIDVREIVRPESAESTPERPSRAQRERPIGIGPQSPEVQRWCRMLSNAGERAASAAARLDCERVVTGMDVAVPW